MEGQKARNGVAIVIKKDLLKKKEQKINNKINFNNQSRFMCYYLPLLDIYLCNIYVPKNAGSATFSKISEAVIDGLTSVNASTYVDTFSCQPRTFDIVGPSINPSTTSSHFAGLISCQFSANS